MYAIICNIYHKYADITGTKRKSAKLLTALSFCGWSGARGRFVIFPLYHPLRIFFALPQNFSCWGFFVSQSDPDAHSRRVCVLSSPVCLAALFFMNLCFGTWKKLTCPGECPGLQTQPSSSRMVWCPTNFLLTTGVNHSKCSSSFLFPLSP